MQDCYNSALWILGAREHSEKELRDKLARKGFSETEIHDAIVRLLEYNYLSDERFASSFARSRASKPLGKQRILNELRMKGINDDAAKKAVDELDADWFELALQLKQKKFGIAVTNDYKEKSKQTRYLVYRGFSFDEVKYAIEHTELGS
ncbi:RecX family transcriptional regulator [Marinomonas piezotolerans]|uniref:Regulatory protein RecX n=2 Tax=Marinomonas piezotolerans TaxID=2213058 RepID=A0A370U4D1_9GAMM|nr:RecX family transcriptional regulator [Marinomonas piezotolerans]